MQQTSGFRILRVVSIGWWLGAIRNRPSRPAPPPTSPTSFPPHQLSSTKPLQVGICVHSRSKDLFVRKANEVGAGQLRSAYLYPIPRSYSTLGQILPVFNRVLKSDSRQTMPGKDLSSKSRLH